MLVNYFDATEAVYETRMAQERAFLERHAQQPRSRVMVREVESWGDVAFTRTGSRPIRNVMAPPRLRRTTMAPSS
jgi:hypothetical protein